MFVQYVTVCVRTLGFAVHIKESLSTVSSCDSSVTLPHWPCPWYVMLQHTNL